MALLSKLREMANRNEVEFTSSDDGYNQYRQALQSHMMYTKAAMSQGNQAAMQVLMDNPGTWVINSANVSQDMYGGPQNVMDMEMKIRFFDPNVCHQFYGILSGAIQCQPVWNPSLTITVPRLDEDDDEDEDTESSFGTQDEGKYVTSFKEAM